MTDPADDTFELRGVLFDMDGVLLDTEPLYTIAYDRLLKPYGAHLDPETKLEIMGRPAPRSAAHVIDKFALPLTPEQFITAREPILEELFADAPAVSGAEEFVRSLKERGLPVAVATSSSRAVFGLKTAKHAWFSLFDVVVCGDDPQIAEGKPAPDIFLLAAKRLGVSAKSCAIFEDSPTGVQAAAASGGRTFALVRPELDQTPPDAGLFAPAYRIVTRFVDADL